MYGRRPRTKSTALFVVDDNFIGNKKEAKELLRTLLAWQETRGYPLEFMTQVSLNVAQDDELLALMRQAHFTTIRVRAGTSRQLEAGVGADGTGRDREVRPKRQPPRGTVARLSVLASLTEGPVVGRSGRSVVTRSHSGHPLCRPTW